MALVYQSPAMPLATLNDGSGGHSSHPDFWHLAFLVLSAVMEVVCVSLPGYVIARLGHFDAEQQKFLANLNMMLFTPCLIFNKLASQLNPDKLTSLSIIPVIFVIMTFVSWSASRLIAYAFGFNKRAANFVIAMGVFGNSNSLPISLVLSLSQTLKGLHWDRIPNDNDDDVGARGILYLLIFQQLGQLVRWSWGYHVLLAPKNSYPEYASEFQEEEGRMSGSTTMGNSTEESPEFTDDEEYPVHKQSNDSQRSLLAGESSSMEHPVFFNTAYRQTTKPMTRLAKMTTYVVRFLKGVYEFMNPPLWAMLFAIIVASVPSLQHLFFAEGSFINNSVSSAIKSTGGVAVPLILVILGANLARSTQNTSISDLEEEEFGGKLLVACLIARMLLPTIIMAPILALFAKYVPVSILDDPIFVIVCFLLVGAPSALQLAQICQINNVFEGVMSKVLFQSYVVWILPSTLVLVMCALEVVEWAAMS